MSRVSRGDTGQRHAGVPAGSLLRGRWLYVSLGVVAAVLHLWAWRYVSPRPPRPLKPIAHDTTRQSADQIWNEELSPQRTLEILQRKPSLGLWLGLWTVLAAGLSVAGLVVTVWTIWTGRLARLFRSRAAGLAPWSLGELARIMILLVLVASLLPFVRLSATGWAVPRLADARLWDVLSMYVLDGFVVLVIWGFAQTKARAPSAVFGLSWRTAARAVRQGLSGYVGLFPWLFGLLWLIVQVTHALGVSPPIEPIHELLLMEQRRVTVVLTALLACVVGPIAEEVLFRGVLFTALRRLTSRLPAILISAALFAAVHTNLIGFAPIVVLGCLLADRYERSRSLWSPIAVHIVHNTFLVGVSLTAKSLLG